MSSHTDIQLWNQVADRYIEQITAFGGHHHYHRPLSWYVELLSRNGFVVTGLHEPPTLPSHSRPDSEWTDYERWFATIPTMLAIACRATEA